MPTLSRVAPAFVPVLLACSAVMAQGGQQPQQQEPAPGRIRVAVEVIAVDVQVLDRSGKPVPALGPDKFTVTINGRRRKVVSAEQIQTDTPGSGAEPGAPGHVPGRVIMLAIDCISFDATASRDVIQSVGEFVRGLQPDDLVGLSAYPNGAEIAPTTDHAAVLRALDTVVGQRDAPGASRFNLRPTDIVDASRDVVIGGGPALDAVVARECGEEAQGPTCRLQLVNEISSTALYYEGLGTASLGMLRTLVTRMRSYPGRKTLLLVSGGMIASDSPGGRPDIGPIGLLVGRAAAAANTAIYTIFIDSSLHDRFAAETRRGEKSTVNRARDSAVLSRWLEQFAGGAGGALYTVYVGNAASALARIKTELSSYYLLGVEPAEEDRDGRTHEVSVKIRQPNVTIRGRRWVMIPKRGTSATPPPAEPAAAAGPAARPSTPAPEPAAPSRVVHPDVAALAQVFDRSSSDAFHKALAGSRDLSYVIRSFRQSDSPWADDRKRTAIFALELALGGLRSDMRDAREEGGRLLAEYHVRVREPAGADTFECQWFVTEAAALAGFFRPDSALLFIPRALQRCPDNARLNLAHAFVSEQQWLRGQTTADQENEIVARYEAAMKFPETAEEARVRAARFLSALGRHDRGLALLDGMAGPVADLELRYFAQLVRGQILRATGRPDEAAAAFRSALATWPGAQSARVALMTLQVNRGNREEAAALADAVLAAPADQYDPWWTYWLGDYRAYPAFIARLRELGQ
jgi:VWFA-related protein